MPLLHFYRPDKEISKMTRNQQRIQSEIIHIRNKNHSDAHQGHEKPWKHDPHWDQTFQADPIIFLCFT